MSNPRKNRKVDDEQAGAERVWRLADDVTITPVGELPERVVKEIYPDGEIPTGYFGIQRKKVRAFPKIVHQDVVDVLRAFGEAGASYAAVLGHFVKLRNLPREELAEDLAKLVRTLIRSNFLVDSEGGTVTAEAVKPSFNEGDHWLDYRIKKNVHCMVDSEIYQIEHLMTAELRALKISQKQFPNREMKEKTDERLNNEFRVIAEISHPNVVALWDCGTWQGRTYGVLDWVDGPPVRAQLYSPDTKPDDREIMNLAIECVKALQAVHDAGYLHGDVHTGNFLVRGGHVCLIDFGLSRPIQVEPGGEAQYAEGGVLPYMPPEFVRKVFEQREGLWGSVASEIYSCGVILFALFTNRYPYKWTPYRKDYMSSILNDPPASFEECKRTAWPKLEGVLHRALAKEPADRFGSPAEFHHTLSNVAIPAPGGLDSPGENAAVPPPEKKDHQA